MLKKLIRKPGKIIVCPACKNKISSNNTNIPDGTFYEVICPKCQCFIKLCKMSKS